jgi:hypothetical protein
VWCQICFEPGSSAARPGQSAWLSAILSAAFPQFRVCRCLLFNHYHINLQNFGFLTLLCSLITYDNSSVISAQLAYCNSWILTLHANATPHHTCFTSGSHCMRASSGSAKIFLSSDRSCLSCQRRATAMSLYKGTTCSHMQRGSVVPSCRATNSFVKDNCCLEVGWYWDTQTGNLIPHVTTGMSMRLLL